jgi:RimJ/RimL family protein N-acetyltransferase
MTDPRKKVAPLQRNPENRSDESRMLQIPELTTERLLLRCFRPEDLDAYAEMMANPDVVRHLGAGIPLSRTDAWRQMAMLIGHWVLRGYGVWAVEERATRRFLGRIGCMNQEGFPAFEIAYTLGPWAWGQGFAREGAAAALDFARNVLKHPRSRALSGRRTRHRFASRRRWARFRARRSSSSARRRCCTDIPP